MYILFICRWAGLPSASVHKQSQVLDLALLLPHLPRWGFSRMSTMTADKAGYEICWPNATMIIIILRRRRMRMRTRTKNEGEHGPHASLWLATRPEPVIVHVQVVFVGESHLISFLGLYFSIFCLYAGQWSVLLRLLYMFHSTPSCFLEFQLECPGIALALIVAS